MSPESEEVNLWRSRVRTAAGEGLSRIALWAPLPKEALDGEYERIYFYHVRKTAGTSISMAFFSLSGEDPRKVERRLFLTSFVRSGGYRFVEHNAQLIQGGRYFYGVSHLPSYVARPPAEGTFTFTVLRDPVWRVVSLYRYLRSADADKGLAFGAPAAERAWAQGSFTEFLECAPREHLLRQLYTFSPTGSVAETVDEIGKLSLVMRTESLAEGIASLEQMTGLRLDVGHERASSESGVIPDAELDQARTLLAPEYEILEQLGREG